MATTEDILSQEFHETAKGSSLNRKFSSTWFDYNTGVGQFRTVPYSLLTHPFPFRIGDALDYDELAFPDNAINNSALRGLRIADIQVRPADNENIKIEILYSSVLPTVNKTADPDTNASWEESFSINSVAQPITSWRASPAGEMDRFITREFSAGSTVGDVQVWDTIFAADSATGEVPDLTAYEPTWSFSLTTYASVLYINRILTFLLSVNATDWLNNYFNVLANRNGSPRVGSEPTFAQNDWGINDTVLYPSFNPQSFVLSDVGRWLLVGCNVSRARFDSYRYDWEFLFNAKGRWNAPNGIAIDLYPPLEFGALLKDMDKAPNNATQGGARE